MHAQSIIWKKSIMKIKNMQLRWPPSNVQKRYRPISELYCQTMAEVFVSQIKYDGYPFSTSCPWNEIYQDWIRYHEISIS
jgi:hypothetical protein